MNIIYYYALICCMSLLSSSTFLYGMSRDKQLPTSREQKSIDPENYVQQLRDQEIIKKFGNTSQEERLNILLLAIKEDNVKVAQTLKSLGAFSLKDKEGNTGLHIAAERGSLAMVEYLLKNMDPNMATNLAGDTPLHKAAGRGELAVVDKLAAHKLYLWLDEKNNDGNTPLHVAALHDKTEVVSRLLKMGAHCAITNQKGNTPVHCAAARGNCEMLSVLLQGQMLQRQSDQEMKTLSALGNPFRARSHTEKLFNIESVNVAGRTSLQEAAFHKNVDAVKCLIAAGANRQVKNSKGQTLLHEAVEQKNVALLRLPELSALVNMADKHGNTPLHTAVKSFSEENTDYIEVLVSELKAKLEICNNRGATPLLLACTDKHVDALKTLQRLGADITAVDKLGETIVDKAIMAQSIGVLKSLSEFGLSLALKNSLNGNTAMHTAAQADKVKEMDYLAKHGVSLESTNAVGETPLHCAAQCGSIHAILFLLAHDVKRSKDKSGKTPLQKAIDYKQSGAQLLLTTIPEGITL